MEVVRMDDRRFGELEAKRKGGPGLSDEEADELGRALAERAGRRYANAASISPDDRDGGAMPADASDPTATAVTRPAPDGRLDPSGSPGG
jgi:hypothetical protein